jgi:hypothetical protein
MGENCFGFAVCFLVNKSVLKVNKNKSCWSSIYGKKGAYPVLLFFAHGVSGPNT